MTFLLVGCILADLVIWSTLRKLLKLFGLDTVEHIQKLNEVLKYNNLRNSQGDKGLLICASSMSFWVCLCIYPANSPL